MPKLSGLFDSFDNLDQIDINNLISWLKPAPNPIQLENYLANKILYPQSLPLTPTDMQIDLAILREALRLNGPKPTEKGGPLLGDNPFLNIALRKILIPCRFERFVPNMPVLTWVFVDGLLLNRKKQDLFEDLWTVVLTDDTDEVVGSVVTPQFGGSGDTLDMNVLGKNVRIQAGSLTVVPCPKKRCEISYKFTNGKLLGKKEAALEVYGGRLGLLIDGRRI
ncbi:MAG: Uncharacterized protein G01um10147_762 [Microgenomates group bacterium Gr01-1014_7]|nr:MAG: Uncharacterized protein G01um10147_762 [Microgenomates group bacterium Gr01-1014_7]